MEKKESFQLTEIGTQRRHNKPDKNDEILVCVVFPTVLTESLPIGDCVVDTNGKSERSTTLWERKLIDCCCRLNSIVRRESSGCCDSFTPSSLRSSFIDNILIIPASHQHVFSVPSNHPELTTTPHHTFTEMTLQTTVDCREIADLCYTRCISSLHQQHKLLDVRE